MKSIYIYIYIYKYIYPYFLSRKKEHSNDVISTLKILKAAKKSGREIFEKPNKILYYDIIIQKKEDDMFKEIICTLERGQECRIGTIKNFIR